MGQNKQVVGEYFKLYVLLNQANRRRNERTSLEFEFVDSDDDKIIFMAHLEGSSEDVRMQLALWSVFGGWRSANYSGLHHLEQFIVNILEEGYDHLQLRSKHKASPEQLIYLYRLVIKRLRSLGLEK